MKKEMSMLYCLLLAGSVGAAAAAPAGSPGLAPAVPNHPPTNVGCAFTHLGDQSRNPKLAVTGLHAEGEEGAGFGLAWTEPSFTMHLDGYEYRALGTPEGSHGAAWVEAGGLETAVALPASLSGRDHDFQVVARYRYPLPDGHVYYWYGPIASTGHSASPSVGCGPIFGQPDTTLAVE